jgi:hypothetical protein
MESGITVRVVVSGWSVAASGVRLTVPSNVLDEDLD